MIGVICSWDVLAHPWITIQSFGWKTYLRAALAGRKQTFLSLLNEEAVFCSAPPETVAIFRQCIDLELRAKRIYTSLANATAKTRSVAMFLATLARQEQDHADLLRLCAAASHRDGWQLNDLPTWQADLTRLGQEMDNAEALASTMCDAESIMRLVVHLESSEINHAYSAVIAASNSAFVKTLQPFRNVIELHLSYIVIRAAELTPKLRVRLAASGLSCGGE